MVVKIKYSVLTYEGEKTTKIATYDNCPNFEQYKGEPVMFEGEELVEGFDYTIEYQVDKWLEEIDKKDWMDDNDVQIIFDWTVVSAKKESKNLIVKQKSLTQSEMVGLWLKVIDVSDEFRANFIAVYSEMKPTIKGLKFEKQIDITFKSMGVGLKSAINVFEDLKQRSKAWEQIKLDDYSKVVRGVLVYDEQRMKEDVEEIIKNNNSLTE